MEEINLKKYQVEKWLHMEWNPTFWGWSINKHVEDDTKAIIFRVPSYYYIGSKRVAANGQQLHCNMIRLPLEDRKCTVTFNFRKIPVLEWDIEKKKEFFEENEQKLREDISKEPKYFHILEELKLNRIPLEKAQELCGDILEVWYWDKQ
jgi:hypothetical protein